ncbi:hypothetical protein GCM10025771_40610 [Niveibacterium umoris]|uniref:Type IV pilus assembly protein PilW n=1 Tax=Niveibacterium umoris TaxID=1193620 RepID=A0A840BII3_9RHOO|nr:PilW family protein [Niveibacterium umoris]MBB4010736.1 type IV pilus assembly protein PilW [Niveibacterium umoris]
MTSSFLHKMPKNTNQSGVSLVELMVSMVIGMLVVLAATQLFGGNVTASRATKDIAQIQEGARVGFDILARQIRMAGFHPVSSFDNFNIINAGCVADSAQAICGVNDAAAPTPNLSDEVRVRFWGADGSTPGVADGATMDCEGLAVGAGQVEEERLRIVTLPTNPGDASTNTPTLVCEVIRGAANIAAGGPIAAQVPLVYGVDTMQILYGEDTNGDSSPDIWRPANLANMANVNAVQVALLLRSEGTNNPSLTYTYRLFGDLYGGAGDAGASFADPSDGRARRIVTFSVNLRNRTK